MKAHRRALAQDRAKKAKAARKAARPAPALLDATHRQALERLAAGPGGFGQRFANERLAAGLALRGGQPALLVKLLAALDAPASPSRHLGEVGGRIEAEVRVTFVRAFGRRTLLVLADDAGNVLVTWCDWATLEVGDRVLVRGRVRAHADRKGVAQTELERTSLAKIAPAA
jgi:hypothetical protein